MSIVDGNVNTFNYPQTSMTAWLCNSVQNDGDSDDAMNNSSSQAQLFFANFTSASQVLGLTIHGVSQCNGPEDVSNATPPQFTAIKDEMVGQCVHPH